MTQEQIVSAVGISESAHRRFHAQADIEHKVGDNWHVILIGKLNMDFTVRKTIDKLRKLHRRLC